MTDSNVPRSIQFASESVLDESQSPLLEALPGEIRNLIWTYSLADYEDETKTYDDATCYKRPDYLAPRRTDTTLLRTCKLIYQEAWFLPWANAEHVFYLTKSDRAPPRTITAYDMERMLQAVTRAQPDPVIQHVHVFAQLWAVEGSEGLQQILDLESFNPKIITITIRHTDWWFWESDNALHVDARWVERCKLPNSLMALRITFESLERKKDQIDDIVAQATDKWTFQKFDGSMLSATECKPEIMRWSGKATWHECRWLRDETGPNKLDYYVSTVTWRPVRDSDVEKEKAAKEEMLRKVDSLNLDAIGYSKVHHELDAVSTWDIQAAGLALDAPTEVVRLALVQHYEDEDDHDHYDEEEEEDENEDEEEDGEDNESSEGDDRGILGHYRDV